MGTFSGMDVEEVERLAARLDFQAKAIAAVVGVVDGAVAGLAGIWTGEDLDAFRAVWHQTHRPQATAAGDQLSVWVGELRRQAADQRAASGEVGTPGEVSAGVPIAGGLMSGLTGVANRGPQVMNILDYFSKNSWSVGRYPQKWESMLQRLDRHPSWEELARYKKSSLFHLLNENQTALDRASGVLGLASMAATGVATAGDLAVHDYGDAAYDGATTLASGLKSTGDLYWAGAAVQSVAEVGKLAADTDWSASSFVMTAKYTLSDPLGALDGAMSGEVHQLPGILLNIFA